MHSVRGPSRSAPSSPRETVPSPACRGGLGWGASEASRGMLVPPQVIHLRKNQPRAKAQATPPQPSPTVAGEGADCGKRRDTRSENAMYANGEEIFL